MKRRSSLEYYSKIKILTKDSNISYLNQALTLLKPALDGGLITQAEYGDLGLILVSEFHFLCKEAKKRRNFEDYRMAVQFGEELVEEKFLGKRRLRKEKEIFIEMYNETLQYKYSLYGLRQSGVPQYKQLSAITADGKFEIKTYRSINVFENEIRANFVSLSVYDDVGLIDADLRASDFIESEMPSVESIYQTEEEYFNLITKEVLKVEKQIEDNFEDLVQNKREFDKVLRKKMIIASSNGLSSQRVAALHVLATHETKIAMLEEQYRQAGIKDLWTTWVYRPISSLIKRAPEFLEGPMDDVIDDIFRDIAPIISEEVQKQVLQKKLEEFEAGAVAGALDSIDGDTPEFTGKSYAPKYNCPKDCDWAVQGYLAGYQNPSIASNSGLKDNKVKKQVIRSIYEQEEDDLSENVIFDKLWGIWETLNPVNLVKMTIAMVKEHGWKVGIGIAIVQAIETFVIPAIVGALGFGPGAIAISSQLPITEIVLPIAAAKLGIEVGDPPVITDDVDDWLQENPGVKLGSQQRG